SLVKDEVIAFFISRFDVYAVHARPGRALTYPIDKGVDVKCLALHDRLDGSVKAIANPTGNFQLLRTLAHGFAQVHALDLATDAESARELHGDSLLYAHARLRAIVGRE